MSTCGHSASRAKQNSRKASKPLLWMRSIKRSMFVSLFGERRGELASACRSTSVMTPRFSSTSRRFVVSSSRSRLALCRDSSVFTSGEPSSSSSGCCCCISATTTTGARERARRLARTAATGVRDAVAPPRRAPALRRCQLAGARER